MKTISFDKLKTIKQKLDYFRKKTMLGMSILLTCLLFSSFPLKAANTIDEFYISDVLSVGDETKLMVYVTVNKPLKVRILLRDTITNKTWSEIQDYDVSQDWTEIAETSISPFADIPVGEQYKWFAYLLDGSRVLDKKSQKVTIRNANVATNTIDEFYISDVLSVGDETKLMVHVTVHKPLKVRILLRDTITNKTWSEIQDYDVSQDWTEIAETSISPFADIPVGEQYKWFAYLLDGSRVLDEKSQKVNITSSLKSISNLNDLSFDGAVSLYPNPASHVANFEISVKKSANVSLVVYNQTGAVIHTKDYGIQAAGKHKLVFESEVLIPGMYFYNVQVDNSIYKGKFVKQ